MKQGDQCAGSGKPYQHDGKTSYIGSTGDATSKQPVGPSPKPITKL